MDNAAADKACLVHATVKAADAVLVLPKRFYPFGVSSIVSLRRSTPILLTLVSAPAHSI